MLTILTPTYNRRSLLTHAYISLLNQTDQDFEWIIVDDGSTDDTVSAIEEWQKKSNPFEIKLVKQENGGKHRALNHGIIFAKGDFTIILDSDDTLKNDAVKIIKKWCDTVRDDKSFAGVAGLKGDSKTGKPVRNETEDDTWLDALNTERNKFGLSGDKAEIYKTDIMKRYPFPEFEGEKFLREGVIWDQIALDGYKIRWFRKVIYLCDYKEDGLTQKSGIDFYANNFMGYMALVKVHLQYRTGLNRLLSIGLFSAVARKKYKHKDNISISKSLNVSKWDVFLGNLIYFANKIKKNVK